VSVSPPRLALDIHNQPESLARVFEQHSGAGRTQLQQAAAVLRASTRVVITAIGASLNAAIPLDSLLASRGIGSCAVEAGELLHYRSQVCDAHTAVVVVSRSGESIEIAMLLEALGGRVPIIGVTCEPGSTLAGRADIMLWVGSLPDEMVAIQSYTGTLLTLHMLGRAAVDELDACCRDAEALLSVFPDWTAAQLAAASGWDPFLEQEPSLYLLARGPSLATAQEGALLFGEIAKTPVVAMSVASFRHGPIEVVDGRFRGLVFAPRGRTRDLNIALARDVLHFGGSVRLLGPVDGDGEGLPWINTPPCPELLAPLVEVVPLQVAAMRLAELKGTVVGSFRYITQVTRDERAMRPPPLPAQR
jgi:glucosamine--fructose-6-phosphate aminotransferase (isomerizing)